MRRSEITDGGDESLTYSELSRGMPVLNKAIGCQCGNNGTGTLPCRESLGLPTAVCTVRLTKSLYSKNLFPTFCLVVLGLCWAWQCMIQSLPAPRLGLVCGYGRCWAGGRGSEEGGREAGRGGSFSGQGSLEPPGSQRCDQYVVRSGRYVAFPQIPLKLSDVDGEQREFRWGERWPKAYVGA